MSSPFRPGESVVLHCLPVGFLDDLPREDQAAVREIVGKPLLLADYDEDGRAELEFTDAGGTIHYLYIDPALLARSIT